MGFLTSSTQHAARSNEIQQNGYSGPFRGLVRFHDRRHASASCRNRNDRPPGPLDLRPESHRLPAVQKGPCLGPACVPKGRLTGSFVRVSVCRAFANCSLLLLACLFAARWQDLLPRAYHCEQRQCGYHSASRRFSWTACRNPAPVYFKYSSVLVWCCTWLRCEMRLGGPVVDRSAAHNRQLVSTNPSLLQ